MKKEYEIRHYPLNNPAWAVEAFWTNRYGDEESHTEGEFPNRSNARLFMKAIKGKYGKPPRVKLPNSEQLQEIARLARRDSLLEQLRNNSIGNPR